MELRMARIKKTPPPPPPQEEEDLEQFPTDVFLTETALQAVHGAVSNLINSKKSLSPLEFRAALELFVNLCHARKATTEFFQECVSHVLDGFTNLRSLEVLAEAAEKEGPATPEMAQLDKKLRELREFVGARLTSIAQIPPPWVSRH
jgi:hypothetical protein